ncbi:carbon storage regulator [Acetoanaerobium pronyense]|uniref:Translational regulator CsrA n=1 Tax=Acetoanaerobium pronyense TaxID=1482736 RepID=A0ABS4KKN4_9FIRM|nr:carbon storage regulator CsrA [Acetoanaerobium pronyense]MBP2027786.1 carbon storage regulator [Acetoanaerobium pronyense]
MLVLKRKSGESIMIGEDVEIKIVDIGDGTVKIGIEAPKSIEIMRKEVIEQVSEENKAAKSSKKINKETLKNLFK